jgi:hypothetical protein
VKIHQPSTIEIVSGEVQFQIGLEKDNCTNIATREHCVFVVVVWLQQYF